MKRKSYLQRLANSVNRAQRLWTLMLLAGVATASNVAAQTAISLTSNSSSYEPILSFNSPNNFLGDTYDAGNAGLDPSKQNGLNGSSSNLDLVGNSSLALLQIGSDSTRTYFRVRLADYKANGNSGSAIVLLNDGSTTFGVGAMIGTSKDDGVYFVTPAPGTTLTAGFTYTNPTKLTATGFSYNTVVSIDGSVGSISTGGDAFLSFSVLNSTLAGQAGAFAIVNATRATVVTNNNSSWNGQINADYISFGATGNSAGNPLEFGAPALVPEPATWVSTGVMVAFGVVILWRRRQKAQPVA